MGCLGRGQGRADDNEETIKKRLNTFETETIPTIAKLKESGNVRTIDASQSKDDVTTATFAAVNEMMGMKPKEAVKEAPVEAPKEEAPKEEAPKEEAPVEEVKQEEAPVEEPKPEEAPVEEPKPEE